jgi:hypothetical protein
MTGGGAEPERRCGCGSAAVATFDDTEDAMCCLFTVLLMLGPRAADVIWWLVDPARWNLAFDTLLWPVLGIVFLPFTTLMYVIVFPGGITGLDVVWLGLAVALDLVSWLGGGYGNRRQIPGYQA